MLSVPSWSDLFQVDKCEQFLDHYRHPFENLPFCMDEIQDGESLVLVLLGVIEEECDEYVAVLSPSSTAKITEDIQFNEGSVSVVIVSRGDTSLSLGWKLPEDKQSLHGDLEKDWSTAKVNGESEFADSLKNTYVDYASTTTFISEIKILKSNGEWLSLEPDEVEFVEKASACFDEERGTGFYSNFFESRENTPYLVAIVSKEGNAFTVDELKGEGLAEFKDWIRQKAA